MSVFTFLYLVQAVNNKLDKFSNKVKKIGPAANIQVTTITSATK